MTDHPGQSVPEEQSGPEGQPRPEGHADEGVNEPAVADDVDGAIEAEFFSAEAEDDGVTPGSAGEAAPVVANVDYLDDLRRLQAEYINYKRRVDRDRDVAKEQGVVQVVVGLLPVLDDIHLAREHGDLEGTPFGPIADKLDGILGRFGVTRLGEAGEEFDPAVHEALMHVEADLPEGATSTTVVSVLQPGYKMGERVVRPARVSVADPR